LLESEKKKRGGGREERKEEFTTSDSDVISGSDRSGFSRSMDCRLRKKNCLVGKGKRNGPEKRNCSRVFQGCKKVSRCGGERTTLKVEGGGLWT